MSKVLLDVKDLRKFFPIRAGLLKKEVASVKAVDGVSFTVQEGEVVGIVGESGCGKSTAARAAIRLIEPTSGEIKFEGRALLSLNPAEMMQMRKKIQMVFQDPYASLNPRKTVGESIGESLLYHGFVKTREEQNEWVVDILRKVNLPSDILHRYPHQFSGGQQQRICIGRAIALNPKLIVCDEAVSALDVSVQAQILNLLRELKETMGLSYVFISHDLNVVRYLCDRVVVLYLGKVMESGPTEEVFSNPRHPYTQALVSATPKSYPGEQKNRIRLKGEIPSPINPPSGCPFRTRCLFAQAQCADPPPFKKVKGEHTYQCIL